MNSDNRIPLVESLAKLMDGDAWYYEWPHGLLPLEPKGFDLVSGPLNFTEITKGMRVNNWGMKTVYQSREGDVQVSASVLMDKSGEDRSKINVSSVIPLPDSGASRSLDFHGLKAGIAWMDHPDKNAIDSRGRKQGARSVILAFRMDEYLFVLSSRDDKPVELVEKTLLALAEEIRGRKLSGGSDIPASPSGFQIPAGRLGFPLGSYLTIEGARAERGKVGTSSLLVDTINGVKLAEPVGIWIDNLKSPGLPEKTRCVLRGYESGRMIGLPDEVVEAEAEKLLIPQAAWQFLRYFIVTSIVEPQTLEKE
jgi:hypothetical protein